MAQCVEVWESDPEAYSYHPVGYMQISCEAMREEVGTVFEQQRAIGYESGFIEGEAACDAYMRALLPDWRARGITSVLHEEKGGLRQQHGVDPRPGAQGRGRGRRHPDGLPGHGLRLRGRCRLERRDRPRRDRRRSGGDRRGPVDRPALDHARPAPEIAVKDRDGRLRENVDMWRYWCLEEGTLGVDPGLQKTRDGAHAARHPHRHRRAARLRCRRLADHRRDVGHLLQARFRLRRHPGGAMPYVVDTPVDEVAVDPYGPASPDFVVGDDFAHMWCSALAFCQERFCGQIGRWKREPSGGLGCFTPDSFPRVRHLLRERLCHRRFQSRLQDDRCGQAGRRRTSGRPGSALLAPFDFRRYAEGRPHPVSHSPFPWS